MGLGILSLLFFALGAIQLLNPWIVCILIVATLPLWVGIFRHFTRIVRRISWTDKSIINLFITILITIITILTFVSALAPPAMDDWDSLAYHLAIPKLFLNHGVFYYINFSTHSNFPFLIEMLYIPGLIFNDVVAAKLINFWTAVLCVMSIAILTRRHFGSKASYLAVIAFVGIPLFLWEATTAYVDISTALYTVICLYFMLNYFDTKNRKDIIGCAIAAGFAASTKMTGLVLIPLFAFWLLVDCLVVDRKFEWKPVLLFLTVAFVVCLPWYIKTYIYTGNPVYPFFYSLFGGRDWTQALADEYSRRQMLFGMGRGLLDLIKLPYNLAAHPDKFYDTPGLFIGPLPLIGIISFILLIVNRNRKTLGLTWLFIALLLSWFALTHQSRYLLPAFAVLAILVAALAYADEKSHLIQEMLTVIFLLSAIFGLITIYPLFTDRVKVAIGTETREEYLISELDIYPAQQFINKNLLDEDKVALFGDTRGFYLDKKYVWADPYHNREFTQPFIQSEDFVNYLKKCGVTTALVNFRFMPTRDRASGTAQRVYEAIDRGQFVRIFPVDPLDSSKVGVYVIR